MAEVVAEMEANMLAGFSLNGGSRPLDFPEEGPYMALAIEIWRLCFRFEFRIKKATKKTSR